MVTSDYYSDIMPPPPAARIAASLRILRQRQGLSVAQLAERSGVARATLTKLEAGQGNPTIDTLYALADTLGAALGDLIDEPSARVEVIRAGEGIRVRGAVTARLLDRIHGRTLAELYEVTLATRARRAGPHPAGVVESLILTAWPACRPGRASGRTISWRLRALPRGRAPPVPGDRRTSPRYPPNEPSLARHDQDVGDALI